MGDSRNRTLQDRLGVSRETAERLDLLAELVKKWNAKINLVSKNTVDDLFHRHILDSAQLWNLPTAEVHHWADLGSGGGFPGLVIGCLSEGRFRVSLVESDSRKAAFLNEASRQLGLGCEIHNDRIEVISPMNADVVSARALAPLPKLLKLAERHLSENGECLFLKGAEVENELKEAAREWTMQVDRLSSLTVNGGTILRIRRPIHA